MNQAGERAAGLANEGDDHRATSNCNSQGEKVISFDADRFLPNGEAHRLSASLSNALVAESPNRLMNHTDILLHALLEERCLNESTVRARKWAITAVCPQPFGAGTGRSPGAISTSDYPTCIPRHSIFYPIRRKPCDYTAAIPGRSGRALTPSTGRPRCWSFSPSAKGKEY